ncbi:MAG: hypothetical protein AAF515_11265 [Pseudomonadota bacterium]
MAIATISGLAVLPSAAAPFGFSTPVAPIEGHPFSAELIHRSVQMLHDGNRIVEEERQRVARDASGRTRVETLNADGEAERIHLVDPVEETAWMLNPKTQTARKVPRIAAAVRAVNMDGEVSLSGTDGWAFVGESPFEVICEEEFATTIEESLSNLPSAAEIAATVESALAGLKDVDSVNIDVEQLADIEDELERTLADISGEEGAARVFAFAREGLELEMGDVCAPGQGDGDGTPQSLGEKTIQGVTVNGERFETVYAADSIGNERELVVSRETWYAPDLQMMLESTTSDPRFGEVTLRVEDLKRRKPKAALFKVPADYKTAAHLRHEM